MENLSRYEIIRNKHWGWLDWSNKPS